MLSLHDLLGQDQGNAALGEISSTVGAEPSLVNSAIQMALPAIIGGLANNAADPQGAQSLDQALSRDHDGSILGNLGGLGSMIFGQLQTPEPTPKQLDAGGILGHILGNNQGPVVEQVSNNTGLNMGQVADPDDACTARDGLSRPAKANKALVRTGSAVCWAVARRAVGGGSAIERQRDDGHGFLNARQRPRRLGNGRHRLDGLELPDEALTYRRQSSNL